MINGALNISFDGKEISPGIILIGEPSPILGTNKLRCLANIFGMLAVIELSLSFRSGQPESSS